MSRINSLRIVNGTTMVVALAMAAFQLVSSQYLFQDTIRYLDTHLAFALTLVFLTSLNMKGKYWPATLALLLLTLVGTVYMYIFSRDLIDRVAFPTLMDTVIGSILIVVVLEAARRAIGPAFSIVALLAIAYAAFGYYLPPPFQVAKMSVSYLISILCTNFTGIYGQILLVSANYIFLFVLLGGLIGVSSASRFFYQFGILCGRWLRSGAAMTAVVGSTLVGTVTGSPGSNVAITGNFTIPLMKKAGYKPEQAGAIEAAASTAGQFIPPVMGAAAFVMAGLTGIPYIKICIAAIIPALFYIISLWLYCHFQAVKMNIAPLGLKVDMRELLSGLPAFMIPIAVIVVLFLQGFTPNYVAFWAVVSTFITTLLVKPRPSPRQLLGGFSRGAATGAVIGATCASIGLVVQVVESTGLGVKLGGIVGDLSGGIPLVALLLTAFVCLILGCGVPTTPAYVLVAIMVAPVLLDMGYSMMQAHLFVLYMAVMSMLTPPIAPAAVIASQLAGSKFLKTSIEGVKPAIAGWLVPFVFIQVPFLILQPGESGWFQIFAIVSLMLTLLLLQVGAVNHYFLQLTAIERVIAFIPLPMIFWGVFGPSYIAFGIIAACFVILTIKQIRRRGTRVLANV